MRYFISYVRMSHYGGQQKNTVENRVIDIPGQMTADRLREFERSIQPAPSFGPVPAEQVAVLYFQPIA